MHKKGSNIQSQFEFLSGGPDLVINIDITSTIFLPKLLYVSLFQVGFSEVATANTRRTRRASKSV